MQDDTPFYIKWDRVRSRLAETGGIEEIRARRILCKLFIINILQTNHEQDLEPVNAVGHLPKSLCHLIYS